MENLIAEKLIAYHKNCDVDKWGQVGTYPLSIFGKDSEEVEKFVKSSGTFLSIQTYGGRFGTYKGFQIINSDLMQECRLALQENKEYQYAMTH